MKKVAIRLSEIEIIPIKPRDGLLAFVSFLLNEQFFCGNIAIHSRPDGGIRLVYPQKTLPNGKAINCFHPIDHETSETVLKQVSKAYQCLASRCGEDVTTCENKNESQSK